jgi:DNA-binding LacI/PurR family transcriptional regulator
MPVSIKDIAKRAGVSHSTVSRALADHPLIPEPTRRRIQRLARRLHYAPNAIARGLVMQRTRAIGVIVTSIADPFVAEVVRGIEQVAGDERYRVFLGTSHNDPVREVNLVKAMREWRVDGVIVASSRVGSLYKPMLKEIGVPIVLINNQQARAFIHSVSVNDVQGSQLATEHLISLGHRAIAHIGGPAEHLATRNRFAGYRRALLKAGIKYSTSLVAQGYGKTEVLDQITALLLHTPCPTAIFCYNDMTAIGALSALKQKGVRIPQDISIVGYDDISFAQYVDPPLTTIRQPKDEMGQLAARMLLDLVDGKQVENIVLSGELVVRRSTQPIRLAGSIYKKKEKQK